MSSRRHPCRADISCRVPCSTPWAHTSSGHTHFLRLLDPPLPTQKVPPGLPGHTTHYKSGPSSGHCVLLTAPSCDSYDTGGIGNLLNPLPVRVPTTCSTLTAQRKTILNDTDGKGDECIFNCPTLLMDQEEFGESEQGIQLHEKLPSQKLHIFRGPIN